jgi:hypothetical protein
LKGTADKGLILQPSEDLTFDCYVDVDFAGLYAAEDSQDPICSKSCTGFVITVAKCPLMWASKLQTETALSTMEAEYVALSMAMGDLISLCRLTTLVCNAIFGKDKYKAKIHSTVFKDNNGALQLARAPWITPRTKHYGVKYHFFRKNVSTGDIILEKVKSADNQADIFTKGLVQTIFETIRKLLMGW